MNADAAVDGLEPYGFHERYSPWTGRAWLEIVVEAGDSTRVARTIPIDARYGALRAALRSRFPDRPYDAAWSDGAFPAAPLGFPVDATVLLLCLGLITGLFAAVSWHPLAMLLAGFAYPIVRFRDSMSLTDAGVRAGPAWAPVTPWHEVSRVVLIQSGWTQRVYVVGRHGAATATVPRVLIPALRARLRRLSGLPLDTDPRWLDLTYAIWQAAAPAVAWGTLVGTLLIAPATSDPWRVVLAGGLAFAALGLLSASVAARVSGWGTGAIACAVGAYAVVLSAIAIASM
jgi:hypothetical protein